MGRIIMSDQQIIEKKLIEAFKPGHLQVLNESHRHSVPANSETHFKVTLASNDFEGQRLVARHQSVYRVLSEELQSGVHALALHLYTPGEWVDQGAAPDSPQCLGGSKEGDSK